MRNATAGKPAPTTSPAPAQGSNRARRSALWANKAFLRLLAGQTVSLFGTQVSQLALPLAAIIMLRASADQLGLLNAMQYFPVAAVTFIAGVLADRHSRRLALIVSNVGLAAIMALVPLTALLGWLSMPWLYLVAFAAGALSAQFDITYQAYVPCLVERRDLVDSNSKLQGARSIAEMAGQGTAGALIQLLTAPAAVLVDCATFLFAAVATASIKVTEVPPQLASSSWRGQIAEGWRFTVSNAVLRSLMVQSALFNMFLDVVMVVFPLYAIRGLHLSAGVLGLIIASGSIGALAGSLTAARLAAAVGIGPAMVLGMGAPIFGLFLLPAASGPRPELLALLFVGYCLYGLGMAIFNIHSVALRQMLVPNNLIGRVGATYRFVAWVAIPLGGLGGGVLAGIIGARYALFTTVAAMAITVALFARSRVISVKDPLTVGAGGRAA